MRNDTNDLFELAVLRHLDAAFNLARWLVGNDQDAEDVVQEAALKALKAFSKFKGVNGKAWFLAIVRNASMDRLKKVGMERNVMAPLDPDLAAGAEASADAILARSFETEELWEALDRLPVPFKEVLVMRELEEMSYQEIAAAASLPIGTVMSRLARARRRLHAELVCKPEGAV